MPPSLDDSFRLLFPSLLFYVITYNIGAIFLNVNPEIKYYSFFLISSIFYALNMKKVIKYNYREFQSR